MYCLMCSSIHTHQHLRSGLIGGRIRCRRVQAGGTITQVFVQGTKRSTPTQNHQQGSLAAIAGAGAACRGLTWVETEERFRSSSPSTRAADLAAWAYRRLLRHDALYRRLHTKPCYCHGSEQSSGIRYPYILRQHCRQGHDRLNPNTREEERPSPLPGNITNIDTL